jgi:hypothetical protein
MINNKNSVNGIDWQKIILPTISFVLFGMAILFTPDIVEKHLSPDGKLEPFTIIKIEFMRFMCTCIGAGILLFYILVLKGNKVANGIQLWIRYRFISWLTSKETMVRIVIVILGFVCLFRIVEVSVSGKWTKSKGYEYYWISEALSKGYGYSLAANHRWYYYDFESNYPSDEYYSTALEEPLYPYYLAAANYLFGEHDRLVVISFQVAVLYLNALLIYLIVRKIHHSQLGILGSLVLMIWWPPAEHLSKLILGPATIGGFLFCLIAFLVLWVSDHVSIWRGFILGIALGVSCLTIAAGLLVTPLAIFTILILANAKAINTWKTIFTVGMTAVLIVLPWTIRNYVVFNKLIPIRTGFGLTLHHSNPILAATFTAGDFACSTELGPIWHASNAREAIKIARHDIGKLRMIWKRSYDCIERQAPQNYNKFNEAQRDQVYLNQSIKFILSEPKLFIHMVFERLRSFFLGWDKRQTIVFMCAVIGMCISFRDSRMIVPVLIVLGYSFTFSLAGSWMYRYRYPIEPIFFILSCSIPVKVYALAARRATSIKTQFDESRPL